jgi:hypothetical protein
MPPRIRKSLTVIECLRWALELLRWTVNAVVLSYDTIDDQAQTTQGMLCMMSLCLVMIYDVIFKDVSANNYRDYNVSPEVQDKMFQTIKEESSTIARYTLDLGICLYGILALFHVMVPPQMATWIIFFVHSLLGVVDIVFFSLALKEARNSLPPITTTVATTEQV